MSKRSTSSRTSARASSASVSHAQVAGHRALEVVHVVEGDPGAVAHVGVDVARHGQVEQNEGPAHARRGHVLELVPADDLVRGSGGADHDVGLFELLRHVVERHRAAAESLGQAEARS